MITGLCGLPTTLLSCTCGGGVVGLSMSRLTTSRCGLTTYTLSITSGGGVGNLLTTCCTLPDGPGTFMILTSEYWLSSSWQ